VKEKDSKRRPNVKSKFNASRGGHAPGHIREWFEDLVEDGEPNEEMQEQGRSARWVCGQLWNCTDIMASLLCDQLDLPIGSTYARGARAVLADLD
jgi:hypothetical protein